MNTTLITNIGELTTNVAAAGDPCGTLRDAAVLVEGGRIAWVGSASEGRTGEGPHVEIVDAGGRALIPGFVDSHTHLVFGGDRADEFEARMAGTPLCRRRHTADRRRDAGGERRRAAPTAGPGSSPS